METVHRCGCQRPEGWTVGPTYHETGIMWGEEYWPHYWSREAAREALAERRAEREQIASGQEG